MRSQTATRGEKAEEEECQRNVYVSLDNALSSSYDSGIFYTIYSYFWSYLIFNIFFVSSSLLTENRRIPLSDAPKLYLCHGVRVRKLNGIAEGIP